MLFKPFRSANAVFRFPRNGASGLPGRFENRQHPRGRYIIPERAGSVKEKLPAAGAPGRNKYCISEKQLYFPPFLLLSIIIQGFRRLSTYLPQEKQAEHEIQTKAEKLPAEKNPFSAGSFFASLKLCGLFREMPFFNYFISISLFPFHCFFFIVSSFYIHCFYNSLFLKTR